MCAVGGILLIGIGIVMVAATILLMMVGVFKTVIILPMALGTIRYGMWLRARPRPRGSTAGLSLPIPLSEGARQAIERALKTERKFYAKQLLIVLVIMEALFAIGGIPIYGGDTAADGKMVYSLIMLGSCAFVLILYLLMTVPRERKARRDLRAGFLRRYRGPIHALPHPMGIGTVIGLARRRWPAGGARWLEVSKALEGIEWVNMDILDHARMILCVRDRQGAFLYRIPRYEPAVETDVGETDTD